jgi:hypothetical protein
MAQTLFAQDSLLLKSTLNDIMEYNAEQTDGNIENTEIIDKINELKTDKLNINTATADDLVQTGLINTIEAQQIVNYRDSNGYFLSLPELMFVKDMDSVRYYEIAPFIKAGLPITGATPLFANKKQRLVYVMARNLNDSGNAPFKTLLKYKFETNNRIQAGFVGENDAGEACFTKANPVFDFVSGHVALKNMGLIKTLVVGDYRATFGQGLVLWNGYSLTSPQAIDNFRKSNNGFRPNTSTNENDYFRGVASTIRFDNFEISAMYSYKYIDANISVFDSVNHKAVAVSSLRTGGTHVTPSEIDNKHALGETTLAANINTKIDRLQIGSTIIQTQYNIPLIPQTSLYNMFAFKGKQTSALAINYTYKFEKLTLYGETAQNDNNANALINGLLVYPSSKTTLLLQHRMFDRDWYTPYSNAYSKNTINNNENGFTASLNIKPVRSVSFIILADQCNFTWLKYRVSKPSDASEYFVQTNFERNKKFSATIRYSLREKWQDISSDSAKTLLQQKVKTQHIRLHCNYILSQYIETRGRIEQVFYHEETGLKSKGIIAYNEWHLIISKPRVKIMTRYTWYNTQSYESRVYAYESDVLYSWPIQMFYNKGSAVSIMANWQIGWGTSVALKWSKIIENSNSSDYLKGQLILNF